MSLHAFQIGDRLDLGGRRVIEVLPAVHTVPAVGFAVDAGAAADHAHWVFTGDTGPNPALWRAPGRTAAVASGHRDRLQRRRG